MNTYDIPVPSMPAWGLRVSFKMSTRKCAKIDCALYGMQNSTFSLCNLCESHLGVVTHYSLLPMTVLVNVLLRTRGIAWRTRHTWIWRVVIYILSLHAWLSRWGDEMHCGRPSILCAAVTEYVADVIRAYTRQHETDKSFNSIIQLATRINDQSNRRRSIYLCRKRRV